MAERYLHIISAIAETIISGGGVVAVVATIIEHSKKNNHKPISWILDKTGHLMTRGVMKEVEELNGTFFAEVRKEIQEIKADETRMEERLENHIEDVEKVMEETMAKAQESNLTRCAQVHDQMERMEKAIEAKVEEAEMKKIRQEIHRFNEGIKRKVHYTKGHWNNMRDDTKRYEEYCKEHKDFMNSYCEEAIDNIYKAWELKPWEE